MSKGGVVKRMGGGIAKRTKFRSKGGVVRRKGGGRTKRQFMGNCGNCGHECHCGRTLKKFVDPNQKAIVVCQNCRCKECIEEDERQ